MLIETAMDTSGTAVLWTGQNTLEGMIVHVRDILMVGHRRGARVRELPTLSREAVLLLWPASV